MIIVWKITLSLMIVSMMRVLLIIVRLSSSSVSCPLTSFPLSGPSRIVLPSLWISCLRLRIVVTLWSLRFLVLCFSEILFFIFIKIIRTGVHFLLICSMMLLVSVRSIISLPPLIRRRRGLHLVTILKPIAHSIVYKISNMQILESVIVPIYC